MEGNFININRKLLDWEWYTDSNTMRLWLHILLKANWRDGRFKGYSIQRGSFVTSRAVLSDELNLSEQQIRTAINHLISTNEITIKTTAKFTIITAVKYEEYQFINQVPNQQVTNNQPTSNHNRKKKKGKKENNNICDFSNFEQREYDFAGMEASLIGKQADN